jgi:hypothetical protein
MVSDAAKKWCSRSSLSLRQTDRAEKPKTTPRRVSTYLIWRPLGSDFAALSRMDFMRQILKS